MEIDELPKSTVLTNDLFKKCINVIIETVKIKIWNSVDLISHYTKHGIDHSERIVQCLGKLLEDFPTLLNQQERFVLLAAIFLHDIGNQLPKYVGIPIKSAYSLEELEKIRKSHHLSSYEAVKDSIKGNVEKSLGLDNCKEYTNFIALLCKYHRKLDLKYLNDTSVAGDPLRLHLLGALLKLGDELDADYRRVDMNVLNIIDIPIDSKFYWWSHHYVQSISIDQGHIKLFFRFPEEYKDNDIVEIFKTKRKESLREQFLEVYDILEYYKVRLYREIEMGDINYPSSGSLEPVPPDLLKYINITITQTDSNFKELFHKTGATLDVNGVLYSDNKKIVEALTKIPKLMKKYKYKEAVRIIEDTYLLTISSKDRMIFSGIAGNCYYFLNDFEKAKSYYMDQLKLTERVDLKKVYLFDTIFNRFTSLGNIGNVYRIQGKPLEAFKFFKQALEISREINDRRGEASALYSIGNVYEMQGKLSEAFIFFTNALGMCIQRKNDAKKEEANALVSIGILYGKTNKPLEAFKFFKQALSIYREINDKQGEASALDNMGIIYRKRNEQSKALQHFKQALKIHNDIYNKKGEAHVLGNMGNVYWTQNKLTEALKFFKQALGIYREINDKQGEAITLSSIGNICRVQEKLTEALDYYKEALIIYKTLENYTQIKKINKIIKILKSKSL